LVLDISELSKSISSIVRRVSGSVVTIFTEIPSITSLITHRPIRGMGSGFIISNDGVVVTNAHVIRGAENIKVLLPSGESDYAEVIAADPYRDLALLKVGLTGLKPLKLGDSDSISIGELVFAIGSPLGLPGPTVTMGVVSAVGRTIVTENVVLEDLIQTDAAINPGNSGGPLINVAGEVIGIATAVIPYAQGIGFAIPVNTLKRFIVIVKKYGRPLRAWIGVYVTQVTPDMASAYSLPISEGVIVVKVAPGTPAHRYGLRVGDIIVRANKRDVKRVRDLKEEIENSIDRGYVRLSIIRGNRYFDIDVPLIIEAL